NFVNVWEEVKKQCGDPVMGSPGEACIRDRDRGGQWDWWSYYYDPIAQDQVRELSTVEQIEGALGFDFPTLPSLAGPSLAGSQLALFGGVALLAVAALTMRTEVRTEKKS
ncbi:MAG: hypothetical protein L0Y56_13635, partial [Nitrospira sp.]|nr:hypothetical protein [Nitrospira sp.]